MVNPEAIKKAMSEIDFSDLYQKLRQAVLNFEEGKTIDTELAMLEAEKNYYVASERWYGYEKLLNGEDASEHKNNIAKLENDFIKLKELTKDASNTKQIRL